jgi:tRNA threonylcarbamoyladenosine biosynthesis protein TsaB
VAIAVGETLLVERGSLDPQGYQHAEKLHVYVEEALAAAELKVADLDAIAVSVGPGSYTGLRIGVAAAKGLAQPHGLPLLAYSSLEALAVAAREMHPELEAEDRIWSAMDARRMEVYSAVFDGKGQRLSEDAPQLLEEVPVHPEASSVGRVLGVGDGAEKACAGWPSLEVLPVAYAHARHGLPLALKALESNHLADLASLAPAYLKAYRAGSPKLGLPNT